MIMQMTQQIEIERLAKRREALRRKLKKHFTLPVSERDYGDFESVVDELDAVRTKIHEIKIKPQL